MSSFPPLDVRHKTNPAPHLVILGAGASVAACPDGDVNGRRLPLMRDLIDAIDARELLVAAGVTTGFDDFEALYSGLASNTSMANLRHSLDQMIHDYFAGMRLPERVTLYDQLLLSLREKDVIASFNWDPFLAQAFRRNRSVATLPQVLFLHGNVSIGLCRAHHRKGFIEQTCDQCGSPFERGPLLFPVENKDYSTDPFVAGEWAEVRAAVESAYMITILGYSAPVTDVDAKQLLLQAWRGNSTREFAAMEVVDIRSRSEIEATWADFFVNDHTCGVAREMSDTWLFSHVRRSCEAYAWATLQQDPWPDDRFPATADLDELQDWVRPLVEEELEGALSGVPRSGR
jgi:hypothetical protein